MTEENDYTDMIEEFKKTGQMPILWQLLAREFVCAANILSTKCKDEDLFASRAPNGNSLWKPYGAIRLLYGLALENLLKGLLIAQGVDATSTGELNKKLKHHDLVKLWNWATLPPTVHTENLLRILEWSIESGKYPVGTKPDPNAPQLFWIAMTDVHDIVVLLKTVEDALREKQSFLKLEKTDLLKLCCE